MSSKIIIRNQYSHRISTVKKSNGHSILRIIAYINARKLSNNLTGDEHNFSHKSGVINTGFFMPHGIKTEMNELKNSITISWLMDFSEPIASN